jgi:acid phosphatase type 7
VYTKGSHNSDSSRYQYQLRENALPLLEAAGLDVLLTGHSHLYERSRFIRGHFGFSSTFNATQHVIQAGNGGGVMGGVPYTKPAGLTPNSGIVSVVCGSSGSLAANKHGLMHPANIFFPSTGLNGVLSLGSVVVDVSLDRLNASFISNTGHVIDSFAIVKS